MRNLIGSIVIVLLLFGCAGTKQQQATTAMLVTKDAIVEVATAADQFCSAGILNQLECAKISIYYDRAKVYYDLAESALETAIRLDTKEAWANFEAVDTQFQRVYADLLGLASQYGIEEGGN